MTRKSTRNTNLHILGICFLRLDFVSFSIFAGTGSVDVDSVCQDTFEVQNLAGGNHRIPTICGFNTGEHSKILLKYFNFHPILVDIERQS